MRILGLDVGGRRIGVALSDPLGVLANALAVIEVKPDGSELDEILTLAQEYEAGRIVIGLPRSMDGSIGEQAQKIQAFAEELAKLTDIPIELSDERLSTSMADQILRSKNKKKTPRQIEQERDAVAAAFILQWYLDEHQGEVSLT